MKVRSPSCWTAGKVGLPISMRASCDAAICPKFTRVYLLRRKISAERDSQVCMVTIRMLLNTWFNTHLVRMDHQLPSSIFRPLTPGPHVLLLAVMSLSVPSPGAAPQHVLGLRGLFAVPSVSSDLIRVRVGRVQPLGDCPSFTLAGTFCHWCCGLVVTGCRGSTFITLRVPFLFLSTDKWGGGALRLYVISCPSTNGSVVLASIVTETLGWLSFSVYSMLV